MEELVRDAIINGNLDCNVHEIVETQILKGKKKESSRVQILGFTNMESRLWLCKESDMWDPMEGSSETAKELGKARRSLRTISSRQKN